MNRQGGFTLLEMLAALAVLALCATVLLGAFGQSARALQQTASSDRLQQAARSVMDQLDGDALAIGDAQGQWDGLSWRSRVSVVPSVAGAGRLLQVDLTLVDGRRQASFSTLRVRAAGAGL